MEGPLLYLFATRLKNQIRLLFKTPGKLILLAFFALLLAMSLLVGDKTRNVGNYRDIRELIAIITALYTLMFITIANRGFNNGGTLFSLSDVQILFPSPIGAQKILVYGLSGQVGTSLMLSFFLVFQYSNLNEFYGISFGSVLLILVGYGLTVFLGNVTAMVLYSMTSADEKRRGTVKTIFYLLFGAFAGYVLLQGFSGPYDTLQNVSIAANSVLVRLMPVSGWLSSAVAGILINNTAELAIGSGIACAYFALLVYFIVFKTQDYYEDVIKSAEVSRSAITARKEGVIADSAPVSAKAGKTGIRKGWGAGVFFYKHLLEDRRSRVFLLGKMDMVMIVGCIVFAMFTKMAGLMTVFVFATYMQAISILYGRFTRELTRPYIYMIPEPPMKKLLYSVAQTFPAAVLEAVLLFIPVALILGLDPVETIACIIARLSFTLLFTSGNIAVVRAWGGAPAKGLSMLLYTLILFALSLPGIILSVVLLLSGCQVYNVSFTSLLALTIVNVPTALFVFFLCRNMLQYAELNNR